MTELPPAPAPAAAAPTSPSISWSRASSPPSPPPFAFAFPLPALALAPPFLPPFFPDEEAEAVELLVALAVEFLLGRGRKSRG